MADADTRDRVANLYAAGLSVREISRALDVTTQAVYKHLKVLELPPPTRRHEEGAA